MHLSLHAGKDFNETPPFEVTMRAGTEVVTASIPIVNDEINEAAEDFVVVLGVTNDTTNRVEYTIQTTVCRIPASDRKCHFIGLIIAIADSTPLSCSLQTVGSHFNWPCKTCTCKQQ